MQIAGEALIALLWSSSLWGAVAAWEACSGKPLWRKTAWGAWIVHTIALAGTLGLLLYLLLGHRYEFYYAWAHGSRLLPTAYLTAALWEGQEGSFLLWMAWHGLLGWVLLVRRDPHWPFLLGGLLLTNSYLATFLLGVSLEPGVVALAGGGLWTLWAAEKLPLLPRLSGGVTLGLALLFFPWWARLLLIGGLLSLLWAERLPLRAAVGAIAVLLLPLGESWGSFPFLYLWEAKPEVPAGFVPLEGNGLNPLLQSFWMVIHPPVLFGGYALAALPFWEGVRQLQGGSLTPSGSRRLLAFLWAAVTVLGAGLLLGAYWAYETLNFGGYWNWDPVENVSFAPWLVLVAAAHGLWVWRRRRQGGHVAILLSLLPFPLVLYSSYLTRSGVLSENSVHSFTDLGLGSWLLYGVLMSLAGLLLRRPSRRVAFPWASSALVAGTFLLVIAAVVLVFLTSLPVLNKLLHTRWALGSRSLQVYYEWMGLLSVPMLFLMGKALLEAYRARGWEVVLWIAGALLAGLTALLWWKGWDFVYHPTYRALLEESWAGRVRGGLFLLLDDLILGAALGALGAVIALAFQRRGGSFWPSLLAHAGFALMISGALFSSGYERVLSQNLSPRSPARGDNLFLPIGGQATALGYLVRYEGLQRPKPPLRHVRPTLRQEGQVLWRFADSLGFEYQVWLPDPLPKAGLIQPASQASVATFLVQNLTWLAIQPADNRYRYQVLLTDLADSTTYLLRLEAELSENSGLLAHPSHIRFWHGDLYVHLTSLPQPEEGLQQGFVDLGIGDTVDWQTLTLTFTRLVEVEGAPHPTFRAWLTAWQGHPEWAHSFPIEFALQENTLLTPPTSVNDWGLSIQLVGFSPAQKKLRFGLLKRPQPDSFITVKILYKPFIGLFWGGAFLLLVGSAWAVLRHRRR